MTALHSVNALLAQSGTDVYYIPTLSKFPVDMSTFVSKSKDIYGKEHSFSVVFDGYFDNEVMSQSATSSDGVSYNMSPNIARNNKSSRALNVLGYDFLLYNEDVNLTKEGDSVKAEYVPTLTDNDSVELLTAIMNTYKALGQECYDTKLVFTKDSNLKVTSSPIQQYLSVLLDDDQAIDVSEGKAWIWMSVSNPELYRDKAIQDKLINSNVTILTGEESTVESTINYSDLYEPVTLAEFCSVLKDMMILYGEPILTEDEETMLVQVYGKNMPYYLSEDELSAVKYLVAKGILNPGREKGYDYLGALSLDDMLDILMAVKDIDSRNTYKDIEITLDSQLVDLGYYETSVVGDINPVNNLEQTYDVSGSLYYDYFIKADDKYTNFYGTGSDGSSKNKLYYSDLGLKGNSYVSGVELLNKEIVQYMGITPKGYYWFQVTVSKSKLQKSGLIDSDDYLTITCGEVASTKAGYYKVKFGGGVYASAKSKLLKQTSFDKANYDAKYVDSTRKGNAQEARSFGVTYLAQNSGTLITFSLSMDTYKDDVSKITFNDTSLSTLKNSDMWTDDTYKITLYKKDYTRNLVIFKVEGCKDLSDFKGRIKHPNLNGKYDEYQTYAQSGNSMLVNFDYLQAVGIARSYVELDNDVVMLTTDFNNVYLCPKEGVIIVGNSIYPALPNSLMYFKKEGKMFVDYRAVLGWSADYYVFQNDNGSITVSLSDTHTNKVVQSRSIFMPMGTYNSNLLPVQGTNSSSLKVQYYVSQDGKEEGVLLSSLFPLANYIVYMGDEEYGRTATSQDYLFVFKEKDTKVAGSAITYKDDNKARNILLENTGFSAPDNWLVYVYPIYKETNTNQHNPPNIHYKENVGYYFTPSLNYSNIYKRYYASCTTKDDGTGELLYKAGYSNQLVLPFVANKDYKSFIYNVNFNTFKYNDTKFSYGTCPVSFLFKDSMNKVVTWSPTYSETNIKEKSYANLMSDVTISPAPTGIISALLNLGNMTKDEVYSTSSIMYYGTTKVELGVNSDDSKYIKMAGTAFYTLSDTTAFEYRILRSTSGGYVLGILTDGTSLIPGEDSIINQTVKPNITNGISLPKFDFGKYKLGNALQEADDLITILTIAVLNLLPRIAFYIFILLIGLSTITNVKPWIRVCDNVFDVYKFFTFGFKNVHTINTRLMFFSSILGAAVFMLFMDGTIIELYAWIVRAISGILTR